MAVLMSNPWRRRAGVLTLALLLALSGRARAEVDLEYAVKAAYLAKFVPFIEWPESAFASPRAPVNICILGKDPFGVALDRAAAANGGESRPLAVRRLASPDLASACQILYLGDEEAATSLPPGLRDRPVLTVTESGHGAGIISFVIEANHVRFDIDEDAAAHSGIRISSKLLSLARRVKRRSGGP